MFFFSIYGIIYCVPIYFDYNIYKKYALLCVIRSFPGNNTTCLNRHATVSPETIQHA